MSSFIDFSQIKKQQQIIPTANQIKSPSVQDSNNSFSIFAPNSSSPIYKPTRDLGMTTLALGEEGGGINIPKPPKPPVTDPGVTTLALGEEGGGINIPKPPKPPVADSGVTTLALGEEGGGINIPKPPKPPVTDPGVTTLALGEEGGGINIPKPPKPPVADPGMTTQALGEEGGGSIPPEVQYERTIGKRVKEGTDFIINNSDNIKTTNTKTDRSGNQTLEKTIDGKLATEFFLQQQYDKGKELPGGNGTTFAVKVVKDQIKVIEDKLLKEASTNENTVALNNELGMLKAILASNQNNDNSITLLEFTENLKKQGGKLKFEIAADPMGM